MEYGIAVPGQILRESDPGTLIVMVEGGGGRGVIGCRR